MNMIRGESGKEGSTTRACYDRLRAMILDGTLPPGSKLKIETLRGLLDTGASPVREALSLLVSDMLVERLDQRGFRTAPAGRAHFEEILLLRCTLEDLALRASIAGADEGWEERVVLTHHRMTRARAQGTPAFEAAHKGFHMALLSNSGLPTLERYCGQLYDLNIRYRNLAAGGAGYGARSIDAEHLAIRDAAVARDADAAAAALLDHYRSTGRYLSSRLED